MANEQTSVPLFAASEVLTAANMNLSAGTGVPVFATTVTRDAGFGGANEKVLAEGQLCYLSSTNVVQYYDGAAWATVGPSTGGGLVYLTGASFSAVTSVSLAASTFTSTYQNYKLMVAISSAGTDGTTVNLRLRASGIDNSTSNYSSGMAGIGAGATTGSVVGSGITQWPLMYVQNANAKQSFSVDILTPQEATNTRFIGGATGVNSAVTIEMFYSGAGIFNAATQFDALSILSTGNFTGTYKVYGYTNS